MPTAQLIDALRQPQAYARFEALPAEISLRQTHISLLFFAGPPLNRVYKVKKPVDMGFLDYSDLAARRHFCHEEVRLNRRLSPEIYLGVRCITRDPDSGGLRIGDVDEPGAAHDRTPSAEVVDYAVEMVRLPAQRMLAALIDRGEIDNAQIDAIAQRLAAFHRDCPTGEGIDEHARPEAIRAQIEETFGKVRQFVPALVSQTLHSTLREWSERFITSEETLLHGRVAAGRIREGHGDLHAENICLLDASSSIAARDPIVIYDCIEFTRRFRCRDVACEIAFLAMDLDFRGFRGYSQHFVRRYAASTSDMELPRLVPFYKLYLAMVRAMVEALKSNEPDIDESDRANAAERARRYALLAATYAIGPALVIMCGLPGSGKSWAARAIAQPFEAKIIRSDVVRKRLAGLAPTDHASAAAPRIYTPTWTQRTYSTMLEQAAQALRHGRTVIADGTFATSALREPFVSAAKELGVPWLLVQTDAPADEIYRRMEKRKEDRAEVSDADWQIFLRARENWRPPEEIPDDRRLLISDQDSMEAATSRTIDALLLQIPL